MRLLFKPTGMTAEVPEHIAPKLVAGGFEPVDGDYEPPVNEPMTRAELAGVAKSLGVRVTKNMTKAELEVLINEARA